jgi:hypothetical protein
MTPTGGSTSSSWNVLGITPFRQRREFLSPAVANARASRYFASQSSTIVRLTFYAG